MAKLVIASIPRSGSTWLFRSICGLQHKSKTPKDSVYDIDGVMVPYQHVKGWDVIKTHLPYYYWRSRLDKGDRVVFLYGDVVESVISTYLKRNESNHYKQCGYFGEPRDLFKEDFLGYEAIFVSWLFADTKKIMVKYENFNFDKVRKFVPFDFSFNEFKLREQSNREKISREQVRQIESTYASLIYKTKRVKK